MGLLPGETATVRVLFRPSDRLTEQGTTEYSALFTAYAVVADCGATTPLAIKDNQLKVKGEGITCTAFSKLHGSHSGLTKGDIKDFPEILVQQSGIRGEIVAKGYGQGDYYVTLLTGDKNIDCRMRALELDADGGFWAGISKEVIDRLAETGMKLSLVVLDKKEQVLHKSAPIEFIEGEMTTLKKIKIQKEPKKTGKQEEQK
jgi:hypothetical protein